MSPPLPGWLTVFRACLKAAEKKALTGVLFALGESPHSRRQKASCVVRDLLDHPVGDTPWATTRGRPPHWRPPHGRPLPDRRPDFCSQVGPELELLELELGDGIFGDRIQEAIFTLNWQRMFATQRC